MNTLPELIARKEAAKARLRALDPWALRISTDNTITAAEADIEWAAYERERRDIMRELQAIMRDI